MRGLRLGGHPLHPALVHFPVACWTAAPVLDALHLLSGDMEYWRWSCLCLGVGIAVALVAMVAGFMDLMALPTEHPGQDTAQRHMLLMGTAWCLFLVDLLLRPLHAAPSALQSYLGLSLSLVGFVVLGLGAYAGAQLVYDFGVGRTDRHES